MAEASLARQQRQAFERDTIPNDEYRTALLTLLGCHAVPVWGWGQRAAYETFAMEGPSLDHWVRTTGLWAEEERHLWEWEQMVAAVHADGDTVVSRAGDDIATDTISSLEQWVDMVLLAVCIDGLGEELVRTLAPSTYGPLARHARRMVMYKRGQCADGCTSLDEVVSNAQLDTAMVATRAEHWMGLADRYAQRVVALEGESDWVRHGIATALDSDEALARVGRRLRTHLGIA